jgi:multidrug efflux pump subunit AcrA (membrane-fusion protein)
MKLTTLLRIVVALLVLVAAAIGAAYAYVRWSSPRVIITDVIEGPVVQAFYATGTLQPDREYPLKANVEGVLVEVLVDKGQAVKQGQKLAVIRVEEYELKHQEALANLDLQQKLADEKDSPILAEFDTKLRVAQEQFDVADREYKRIARLRESNAASQSDFDRASEQVALMRALVETVKSNKAEKVLQLARDVKVAQAALGIAQWNLDQQTITSPIDGVVLDRPAAVGTRVAANGHIMQVADVSPPKLVMRAMVDEEDKTRVQVGQQVKVSLYAYDSRVFQGTVKTVYPKADADRRTFEVDIAVEPDEGFAAGMTAELAFIVREKQKAVVVPSQAVQDDTVWVLADGQVTPVEIEVGLRSIERVEVTSGLSPGQQIVISPPLHLTAGRSVSTTYLDPEVAAGLNKPKVEGGIQGGIEKL